ncbi:hypothetical protein [Mycobacterium dioxanotrophicus]|uniref:hypothetical protein n=1 Tax=Mycobacterium dioxanotrophicus TaxID=482462 RepID=UPI0012FB8267|nr:hypothetical protein [Mycobacterium dioxanotrophicus]
MTILNDTVPRDGTGRGVDDQSVGDALHEAVTAGLDRGALRVEAQTMLGLLNGADSEVHAQLHGEILPRKAKGLLTCGATEPPGLSVISRQHADCSRYPRDEKTPYDAGQKGFSGLADRNRRRDRLVPRRTLRLPASCPLTIKKTRSATPASFLMVGLTGFEPATT